VPRLSQRLFPLAEEDKGFAEVADVRGGVRQVKLASEAGRLASRTNSATTDRASGPALKTTCNPWDVMDVS